MRSSPGDARRDASTSARYSFSACDAAMPRSHCEFTEMIAAAHFANCP